MRTLLSIFCCLVLIHFIGCKEDKDDVFPTVTILEPSGNSSFDVLDPVAIKASVSDNNRIETVRISLISEQTNNQVLPSKTIQVNQKEAIIEEGFVISDSLLDSGRYFFRVEAFDGENYLSAFRFITINGIAKRKLGLIVSCDEWPNGTGIYYGNSGVGLMRITGFTGSYQASVFNSRDQDFWFVPSDEQTLSVYDMIENSLVYSDQFLSNFSGSFSDLALQNRDVLIGLRNGAVDGRSQNFSDSYTYLAQSGRRVGQISANETYVVIEEFDNNGANRTLTVLRRSNGSTVSAVSINEEVVEIVFTEEDRCIVLTNTPQGGRGVRFEVSTGNLLNTLFTTDPIRSAMITNRGNLFISTNSGIKFYNQQNGSLVDYVNKPNAVMSYDELNNQLLVGFGRDLEIYTYPNLAPVSRELLPSPIVGINVRFNKD